MNTIKRGYTLLEILVVMAIIAILLSMLVSVMADFRRTVELQQASDFIASSINETKNYAANNILPDQVIIDKDSIYAYQILPTSNNLERRICEKYRSSSWDCTISGKIDMFLDMDDKIVLNPVGCDSILLINLTSDWQVGTYGTYGDNSCVIEMSHRDDSDIFRKFVFDGKNNTFEIEYGS